MKKYPFAKLYLGLLLVLAFISIAGGIILFVAEVPSTLYAYNQLRVARVRPLPIDAQRLVSETKAAIGAVSQVTPGLSIALPEDKAFPTEHLSELKARDARRLRELVGRYDSLVAQLKTAYLEAFDLNMKLLRQAAQEKYDQLSVAAKGGEQAVPRQEPVGEVMLFEENEVDERIGARLNQASQFLASGVAYYSPSDVARKAAEQANINLSAARRVYDADMHVLGTAHRQAESLIAAVQLQGRPQAELIREFIVQLDRVKTDVDSILRHNWRVENTIADAGSQLEHVIAGLDSLRGKVNTRIKSAAGYMFKGVLLGLLLLIVRDFLSAAIDTATNTGEMKNALSGSEVKYDG